MPGKDYAATRYSGLAQITAANAAGLKPVWNFSTGVLARPRGPAAGGRTTRCTSSRRIRTCSTRSTSRRKAIPLRWKYRPDVDAERDRHRLLRRDQPRRRLRRRQDRLQPARRPHRGGRRGDRPRALEHEDRRHHRRRDDADGAARREGPRHRRAVGRRDRHARLGQGARPRDRQARLDRATTSGPDADMLVRPGTFKPFYDKGTELGARRAGRRTRGRQAARRCGDGCRTTRSSTWSTTASATRRRTTRSSGRATTSGPTASSRAGPATARWSGRTSSRRTTTGTTTPTPR